MVTYHDAGLYARSFSDVYDSWYGTLDDPAALVASLAALHGPGATVVELGSGTGRLAGPLHNAGYNVVSVDISSTMLLSGPDGPHRVCADMATLPLSDSCAQAVVVAYNTLFNLAATSLQQQCFDEASRILGAEGVFAVETFVAPADMGHRFGLSSSPHPDDPDALLTILTGPDPDDPDIIVGTHLEQGRNTICRPWRLAYQSPDEPDMCAATTGLRLIRRTADWSDSPFDASSDRHVSWYTPSAGSRGSGFDIR